MAESVAHSLLLLTSKVDVRVYVTLYRPPCRCDVRGWGLTGRGAERLRRCSLWRVMAAVAVVAGLFFFFLFFFLLFSLL